MASKRPTFCRICGRSEAEAGRISWRGKCLDCGLGRMVDNALALSSHSGPELLRWRKGVAAGVGGVIVDKNGVSVDTPEP